MFDEPESDDVLADERIPAACMARSRLTAGLTGHPALGCLQLHKKANLDHMIGNERSPGAAAPPIVVILAKETSRHSASWSSAVLGCRHVW